MARTIVSSLENNQYTQSASQQKETNGGGSDIQATEEGDGLNIVCPGKDLASIGKSTSGTSDPKSSAVQLNFVDLSSPLGMFTH